MPCLRGTAAGAASDRFGLPLPGQAFALSHFRTPHEAPLTGQDAIRIRQVLGAGITIHGNSKNLMLMNENIFNNRATQTSSS
jgi:hypothetical protein